ncbi:ataxin-7-like protein 3 isoform X1 [Amblyraja radiata]|uniref:ataxin-7-like protein 3 isoform X1 n=1 Tax=Amblyraja radiata TaxID=386614 RepID=UPI0014036A38|nr:ataxin-7-like protein 3 isoform X1 [Amblyraja radiata]XP_032891246.1 ataxin-7-like protein 3 isoform X1 [Amblyraja radiata]XP_032891247.1 ataxin-7-like protein 3 isoform X1 [Amblyraja radiata]XP_055513276.1 ataxin-7-like protein 3 isoform X1 [Leucoraja erinacea]XP_055513278.1 ataxin-7-like protein 3 isoform X1 [Leucoraja erinacea]
MRKSFSTNSAAMPKLKRVSSEKKQKYWRQLKRDQRQLNREHSDQAMEFDATPESSAEQALAHEIYSDLVDDACLGLCFEVHRAVKCGYFFLDETDPDSMKDFEIVDQPGVDIFGQVYNQWKNKECECPNCSRSIAASRFAPHLEKCLGMGRNSSRIANRRIASSNNLSKSESDQEDNDDINDNDWSYGSEKKAKKRKSDKNPNSPRRSKSLKHKNDLVDEYPFAGELSGNSDPYKYNNNSGINYENLGPEELRSLLTTQCGVISEHTKKMCTRSLRCPQHTDEQRRSVRVYLLGSSVSLPESEVTVENESYDASESQSFMSRLQWDGTSDISPSDSASSKASTNNSDSKKSKKKKPHLGLPSAPGMSGSKKKKLKAPVPPTSSIYDDIN